MTVQGIGAPVKRREDFRFIKGIGKYTDDINLPNQVYCYILRSSIAHARIVSIDTSPLPVPADESELSCCFVRSPGYLQHRPNGIPASSRDLADQASGVAQLIISILDRPQTLCLKSDDSA